MGIGYVVVGFVLFAAFISIYPDGKLAIGIAFAVSLGLGTGIGRLMFVQRTQPLSEPRPGFKMTRNGEVIVFGCAAPLLAAALIVGLSVGLHLLSNKAGLQIDVGALSAGIGSAFIAFFGIAFIGSGRREPELKGAHEGPGRG